MEPTEKKKISVDEFEDKFERIEGLKIIIRAPKNSQVPDYPYERALDNGKTVSALKRGRLSLLGDTEYEILNGDLEPAGGKTKIATVKKTYGGD